MRPQKLDVTLAFKAMALHPGLSALDKRVGATILDHYNHRTGQCDPGTDRLASLLGLSIRTVHRSVEKLDGMGLIGRIRHGGRLNRNSYQPDWERFRAFDAVWRANFEARLKPTDQSPGTCQALASERVQPVTQTSRTNQKKGTSLGLPREERVEQDVSLCSSVSATAAAGGAGATAAARTLGAAAGNLARSFAARSRPEIRSPTISSADAARQAALRRWNDALNRRFATQPLIYQQIIAAIDQAMIEAATDAELKNRGGGIAYIVAKLPLGPLKFEAPTEGASNPQPSPCEDGGGDA